MSEFEEKKEKILFLVDLTEKLQVSFKTLMSTCPGHTGLFGSHILKTILYFST